MKINYCLAFIILIGAAFNGHLQAQDKVADTSSTSLHMANYFNKAIGQQSRIFTGPIFIPYKFVSKTNANFQDTTTFIKGSVNYEGVNYNDVPLIYDIDRDMLLCRLYNNFSVFSFLSYRVSSFDLMGHHFIRLVPDSISKKEVDEGYYDELYNDKVQVLARRSKIIQEETGQSSISYNFYTKVNYFLKKRGVYYNINSQGKLLDVLKDKKKELKQYLKSKNIRYKDNPEQNMVLLAAYYAQLTN